MMPVQKRGVARHKICDKINQFAPIGFFENGEKKSSPNHE